jgi:hypothetical protein
MSKLKKYNTQAKQATGNPPQPPEAKDVKVGEASDIERQRSMPDPTTEGGNFLKSFLNTTPFLDLFEQTALRSYSNKDKTARVAKMRLARPRYFKACILLDAAMRLAVAIILIVIATYAALKLLAGN